MNQVETLKNAWVFDPKGQLKQTKLPQDKEKSAQIYNIAKQALRYSNVVLLDGEKIKRISFVNGNREWLITLTPLGEIIVMNKQEKK